MPSATWNAEQSFRDLYTRLDLTAASGPRILGVTSAVSGEGKTTVAGNLAWARAHDLMRARVKSNGCQVTIVDCSGGFDEPNDFIDRIPAVGLIQYLRGESELVDVMEPSTRLLSVIPRGGSADDFSSTIRSIDFIERLQQLRRHVGLAVLDLPSVLSSSDTQLLANAVDQIVMVVRARATPVDLIERALREIPEEKVVGIVLNDARPDLPEWLDRRL